MKTQAQNNTFEDFSLRLLEIMRKNSLTQKELAMLTNLSQGAISKYIRGAGLPGSAELYKLSKILGVSMEWLMGDDDTVGGDYWKEKAIKLRTQLIFAVETLEGAVSSMKKNI